MRRGSLLLVPLVFATLWSCGDSSSTNDAPGPADAGRFDAPSTDAPSAGDGSLDVDTGPACMAGAACSSNTGAPCRTGVVECAGGQAKCADGPPASEGTTCSAGLCTRGACLAPATVSADLDLSAAPITAGRTCAESPAFSIASLTSLSATLATGPAAGCLAAGDELLLINLQGGPSATTNVGNWELLSVASVLGTVVTFSNAKTKSYGTTAGSDTGIGAGATDQKVVLVRVPQFGALTIGAGKTLTAGAWAGDRGGVVALRASKLTVDGTISAAGLGYRSGRWSRDDSSCSDSVDTEPGESIDGAGVAGANNNVGGAGGLSAGASILFNSSSPLQAGAGHAQVGDVGSNGNGRTLGPPGIVYGTNDATKLTLGSGQGGNVTCENGFAGPALVVVDERLAGGIVLLLTERLDVGAAGAITVSAKTSSRDVSASGGYVFIRGGTLNLGTTRVSAIGGTGTGINGPTLGMSTKSGDGYIVVKGTTVTGVTTPAANQL